MHESRTFFQVGLDYCFVINVFHIGLYGPLSRSNWTPGVQLLLEWVRLKETKYYSICEEEEKAGCFAIVVLQM